MVNVVRKILVKKFQYYYFWPFFQSSVPMKQKTRYNNTMNMSHMLYIFLVTMNFYFNPLQTSGVPRNFVRRGFNKFS